MGGRYQAGSPAAAASLPLFSIQAGEHQVLFGRRPLPLRESACRLDVEADLFAPLGRLLPGLTALNIGFTLQPQHLAQVRDWEEGGGEGGRGRGGVRLGLFLSGAGGTTTLYCSTGALQRGLTGPYLPTLSHPLPPFPTPAGSPASAEKPGSATGRGRGRARAVRAGTSPACAADGAHAAAAAGVQGSE